MKNPLRSSYSTEGRRMAGARALWRANGLKEEQFGKPIIAIVNSFTQFVPGHVHLHEIGQQVKAEIEKLGCFAAEFNTIAIDDGIAMGHDGMLYSLPSRDIIADSVEYMVNAHKADAMVCISNCDKITPGMLMASMRLNIPTIFVSGGPMEAGELDNRHLDLIDAMIESADTSVSDERIAQVERNACPGCGCCSGMFTANSMNCLNEAIGLALPGNGTIVATHVGRTQLFRDAARQIVENAYKYYRDGDESVLPRSIATRQAFLNAMSLDIAMGGSTNTVLHLLAIAQEAEADFTMDDIDMLSRKTPCLCKVAPNTHTYHVQDVNRAGGIMGIMNELLKNGLVDGNVKRVDGMTLAEAVDKFAITSPNVTDEAVKKYKSAPAHRFSIRMGSQETYYKEELLRDLENGRALPLNGSRYVLVEFDPSVPYQNLYRGIRQLLSAGYVPIVAHMERYRCLREERNLQDLRRSGCLLQMNYDSLNGSIFQAETRWCRNQVKKGYIHLMGTDMHRIDWREPKIQEALKWLENHLDEEMLRRLLRTNAIKVLRNEPIGEIQKQG